MANNTAEGLVSKLGLTREELEAGNRVISKKELAKILHCNLNSYFDRLKFDFLADRIYHLDHDWQLVFIAAQNNTYTPKLESPSRDCPDIY